MLEGEIEEMRRLGLTERTEGGEEAVRVSVQCRRAACGHSREGWRGVLQEWEREVGQALARHGAQLVQGSLSVSGQTVEALVPVGELTAICDEMARRDARVDLLRRRRAID